MDGKRSNTHWVHKNSPYKGHRLFMHLLIAQHLDDSENDYFLATRKYLAQMLRCNGQTVVIAEHDLVKDGYLEVRSSEQYGQACREYRLLFPESLPQESAAS